MAQASVDGNWKLHDLRVIILENEFLRAVILPEVGARIYQLIFKPRDLNLIWRHPRIKPAVVPFGARYDDVWCGGWDETLPNSDPGTINGELQPDHGEVWAEAWECVTHERPGEVGIHCVCRTRISDILVEKTITLRADEAKLRIAYRLGNKSGLEIPVLWNLHAAMAVSSHHRIQFPAMSAHLEPAAMSRFGEISPDFRWPILATPKGALDLQNVPPTSAQALYFFYGSELRGGWCGICDDESGLAYGFAFDPVIFKHCWLFASYGGWRNLNVAVLEPSTGYPCRIEEAVPNQRYLKLGPGDTIETTVVFSVAEGLTKINSIGRDGEIS
jgi:hypothetical protein